MASKCLELGAYKIAREQARSKVYTPPELRRIEGRILSKSSNEPVYHCPSGRIVDRQSKNTSSGIQVKRRSK